MDLITILPVVTKDLPISPRFTPFDFLSRCKFGTLTTRQPMVGLRTIIGYTYLFGGRFQKKTFRVKVQYLFPMTPPPPGYQYHNMDIPTICRVMYSTEKSEMAQNTVAYLRGGRSTNGVLLYSSLVKVYRVVPKKTPKGGKSLLTQHGIRGNAATAPINTT